MNTKIIIIDNQETDYTIDTQGNIYSIKRKKYIKPIPDKDGYLRVNLYLNKKMYTKKVHRLVAISFIPNPLNLPVVNHLDCDILNNDVSNLEWTTFEGNTEHAKQHGLLKGAINPNPKRGEEHHNVSITEEVAIKVIKELLNKKSVTQISNTLGVSRFIIYDILYKRTWKHLTKNIDFPAREYKYSKELKKDISELIKKGCTTKYIFKTLNLERNNTTNDIVKRIRKNLLKEGWVLVQYIDI